MKIKICNAYGCDRLSIEWAPICEKHADFVNPHTLEQLKALGYVE